VEDASGDELKLGIKEELLEARREYAPPIKEK
jgi:hypothetical protein